MVLISPQATLMDAELHNKLFAGTIIGFVKNNYFVSPIMLTNAHFTSRKIAETGY
jgi:hypothetical protein